MTQTACRSWNHRNIYSVKHQPTLFTTLNNLTINLTSKDFGFIQCDLNNSKDLQRSLIVILESRLTFQLDEPKVNRADYECTNP